MLITWDFKLHKSCQTLNRSELGKSIIDIHCRPALYILLAACTTRFCTISDRSFSNINTFGKVIQTLDFSLLLKLIIIKRFKEHTKERTKLPAFFNKRYNKFPYH